MLKTTVEAADICASRGGRVAAYSFPWVKPLDTALVRELAGRVPLIVTIEEARASGGLGSAVAEVLAGLPAPRARLLRLGFEEEQITGVLFEGVHTQEGARRRLALDAEGVAARVLENLR
jgi:transketolase